MADRALDENKGRVRFRFDWDSKCARSRTTKTAGGGGGAFLFCRVGALVGFLVTCLLGVFVGLRVGVRLGFRAAACCARQRANHFTAVAPATGRCCLVASVFMCRGGLAAFRRRRCHCSDPRFDPWLNSIFAAASWSLPALAAAADSLLARWRALPPAAAAAVWSPAAAWCQAAPCGSIPPLRPWSGQAEAEAAE